ncbi:MAG: NAD(P)/FAD-dependent oxidoreductase [Clostridiales bacterium]|nr:NAD(P)/FAD-dependent oxidoreductase [Clostridiales bacterium]
MGKETNKLQNIYDCIVVGSGMGGLTSAALLAKEGKSVLVVEQADKLGGFGQSYVESGFVFDYAIHSIASWGFVYDLLQELGEKVENGVVSSRRGDHIIFRDEDYWATNVDHIVESLSGKFPDEKEHIESYFGDLVDVMTLVLEFNENPSFQLGAKISMRYSELLESTLEEVLDKYFDSKELKALVYGTHDGYLYDYAWHYSAYHLFYIKYINDGHAVKGGSRYLVDAFERAIIKFNGDILCNTMVKKIIIENGRACGVELDNGQRINAKEAVISNADARLTFNKLLDINTMPVDIQESFRKWDEDGPSLSYYIVNLGLDIDVKKEYGMEYDLSVYFPSYDLPRVYKDINNGILPDDFWLWMVFPSVNDLTLAPEGCSTAILAILVPYDIEKCTDNENNDYFDGYKSVKEKKPSYYFKKEEIEKKLIARAEEVFPGMGEHIVVKKTWTPQTLQEFTLNHMGSTMGFRVEPPKDGEKKYLSKLGMDIKTSIQGLYLVGGWSQFGFATASVVQSGRFAAYHILNKELPKQAISKITDRVISFNKKVGDFNNVTIE